MTVSKKSVNSNNKFLIAVLISFFILSLVVSNFVSHFREKYLIMQFKKEYIAYNNALTLTAIDMFGETGCYYSTDKNVKNNFKNCDKFYKRFATNLNVRKYCKKDALSNGCVPVYKTYTTEARCAGYSESMMNRFNQAFVMSDLSSLIVYNYPTGVQKPMFAIDVNGSAKPNKSGYDLFSMVIMRNKSGDYYFYPNITYCLPSEKGGYNYLTDIFKE